jgi:hypothetical protein
MNMLLQSECRCANGFKNFVHWLTSDAVASLKKIANFSCGGDIKHCHI